MYTKTIPAFIYLCTTSYKIDEFRAIRAIREIRGEGIPMGVAKKSPGSAVQQIIVFTVPIFRPATNFL